MKNYLKTAFILAGLLLVVNNPGLSVSAVNVLPEITPGFNLGDQTLSVDDIANLKRKDIESKLGIKLKFKERIALSLVKRKVKKELKRGKTIEEIQEEMPVGGAGGFHWIGFLLGLFLTVIGVLLAHLIYEKGSRGRKWAWIGGIISIVILGTALIV